MKIPITLKINGEVLDVSVEPNQTLLDVLREELALTGSKKGCDSGVCGACTVLIDGKPALGCMTLAVRCQDREILTIEGLSQNGRLHPLQQAAIDHNAVQCGFCTPGWILTAKALLENTPRPTLADVRQGIAGNLCRCTGYKKIEEAIMAAAEKK
ncbi:MAG: (2Fe-2S)-binding protein [Desulfobacterales bacterium]|nr:(2Fe-2S)-binding protein [Desulfobacterales bacterium]